MTTANEYPKACTMEEAIACVRDGGEAQASAIYSGFTGFLFFDMDGVFRDSVASHEAKKDWLYQITKPAPSTPTEPRTYSTAEAITELYAGRVKKFTGSVFALTLNKCDSVVSFNALGDMNYIPNIRWSPVVEKPAGITRNYLIEPGDVHRDRAANVLRDTIRDTMAQHKGDVRVTWKVEAV